MPLSPNIEINRTMFTRLVDALPNCGRAIVSLHHRLFRKRGESGQEVVRQYGLVRATQGVDERRFGPNSRKESLNSSDFTRTQSQLMETMLKSMILASGWSVEGSGKSNGAKPKR
jgi:hypothetical protein